MKKNLIPLLLTVIFFAVSFFIFDTAFKYGSNGKKEGGPDRYPYELAWLKRVYPYYNADPRAISEALKHVKKMKQEQAAMQLSKGIKLTQWEFAGPTNIGGRVVDIEFNPSDPNIVYAAAATGGVFKSTDMGVNWFPIFDDNAVLTIGDIAVDPNNPDVIYVGTGEANGGHNNFAGGGVFKSTDAGSTWNFLGLDSTTSIGRIILDPSNSQIVYLAAVGSYFSPNPQRGIYKSIDGGITWNKSLFVSDSTGAIDIVINPTDPSFLMAAMWERVRRPNASHLYGPSSAIYTSTNSGDTWEKLGPANGLPNPENQNIGRIGLSLCTSSPNIIYALYNDGAEYLGLYKTTNAGVNWTDADPDKEIYDGASNFSWYFGQVRVHPSDPNKVFAMDVAFMRSINGGSNWSISYETHVDHHALAFHPTNPDYLINGNDGGINISTNGGASWSNAALLPVTQFYEINIDFQNPQRLYGGTQDNGTVRTKTGAVNDWDYIYGGDGFYVIVDPTNPNIIYAESQNGYLGKSTDGGNNWDDATNGINFNEPTNWSTPVVMDPNNHNVLYYGTDRVYRTTNGAQSWTAISGDLSLGIPGTRLGTVTTIAPAPSNSDVIYAGTDDSQLWVTTDYGNTWNELSASLPERWITRVAVDPSDESIVYVTFSGLKWRDPQSHVFKSTNYGQTWTDISSNLPDAPINAFAVDYNLPDRLYVGSDVGAFVSFNGGSSWEILGEGLPTCVVYDFKIHPTANYLVAGTHARSMYKIDLNSLVTGVSDDNINIAGFELQQNYPNPFNPSTTIKYTLGKSSDIKLKVYDITGKEIAVLINGIQGAGKHSVNFSSKDISSGVYFYSLEAEGRKETRKMIVLK